jgi:hypothetical protein
MGFSDLFLGLLLFKKKRWGGRGEDNSVSFGSNMWYRRKPKYHSNQK